VSRTQFRVSARSADARVLTANGSRKGQVKRAILAVFGIGLVACGGKGVFSLSAMTDNDRGALSAALAHRQLPPAPSPINGWQKPRVFAVQATSPKSIVAFDLAAGAQLWKANADVQSRIWVGGNFIIDVEGHQLVARDQNRGDVRWKASLGGELVGAAADRDRAYAVWHDGASFTIAAFDGSSGDRVWKMSSSGKLGAPAAQGGVVYVPYLEQWLSILDGKTGVQLARLRGIDEQISTLRVTSRVAYYGSKQGMFELDARSVAGTREGATYGKVTIPPQLDRARYGRDMYDPIDATYSANDRAHVLWATEPTDTGPMKFSGGGYAIAYFRYVFGFDKTGALTWAYDHPRIELIASAHTGAAILAVAANGDIVELDPKTGGVRQQLSLGTTAPVLGATFDADGWSPPGEAKPAETLNALVEIARDHDARFERVKELAVATLAKLPGPEVTAQLLAVLADERAPLALKDDVVDLIVKRKDPASLPVLTAQLLTQADYLAKTEPESLGPVAKAIAGIGAAPLDPVDIAAAVSGLESHLDAPTTPIPDLVLVIDALAAIGGGTERAALTSHVLLYHSDDELAGDAGWDRSIVRALVDHGGPAEHELLHQIALDPRTVPSLTTAINDALVE